MLAEVTDDELTSGFVPNEVDGHAFLGVSAAQGDMLIEKDQLSLVFETIVVSVYPDHGVADHWPVEIP